MSEFETWDEIKARDRALDRADALYRKPVNADKFRRTLRLELQFATRHIDEFVVHYSPRVLASIVAQALDALDELERWRTLYGQAFNDADRYKAALEQIRDGKFTGTGSFQIARDALDPEQPRATSSIGSARAQPHE